MWTRMWQARIKMRRSYVFLNTKLAPKMKAIQCQKLSKKIPQPLQTCWIGSINAHVQARIEPPPSQSQKLLLCQGKCAEAGKTQIAAVTFHKCDDSRYRTRLSTPTCCASICIYLYQHLSTFTLILNDLDASIYIIYIYVVLSTLMTPVYIYLPLSVHWSIYLFLCAWITFCKWSRTTANL